ncbi:hypothetical protein [Geochorda subterranea]|uniref:Uncharacterized protein n=1 Tax=Geochorda subterranea TaxID=3109564 RepID=A0ABZ1BMY0_9FIRM|nr:hypothetical protein [Limnochorda sp. LNt]WRP13858.1 hypothetical protein VLY81_10480 [Limnochorda sp. LNt]
MRVDLRVRSLGMRAVAAALLPSLLGVAGAAWVMETATDRWALAAEPAKAADALDALLVFPDVTGMTGLPDGAWLNPAAATGLERAVVSVSMVTGGSSPAGADPVYAVAVLEPGGPLAGGFTGSYGRSPVAAEWEVAYAVAGRVAPLSVGGRVRLQRAVLGPGDYRDRWSADAGLVWELTRGLALGAAADHVALAAPRRRRAPELARGPGAEAAGGPGSAGVLGVHRPAAEASGLVAYAGALLRLGRYLSLAGTYVRPAAGDADATGRWSAGARLEAGRLAVEAAWRSDGRHRLGASVGF